MTLLQVLTTIFEVALAISLLWCFFNEDTLISLERRLFANIRRRRMRVVNTHYTAVKSTR